VNKLECAPRPREVPGREERLRAEAGWAVKHAAVSVAGFAVDFAVLHLVMRAGLEPAWARVVSLACAVNATFVLNGALVFRCLGWGRRLGRQWLAYLATNAFGNLCNYWIFVTLVSLHRPLLSRPVVALAAASLSAWGINYSAARLVVFGKELRQRRAGARL
jgi:putative flippase GtrA